MLADWLSLFCLVGKGMTMCVTHEAEFTKAGAVRIVFMDAGKIVEINELTGFFINPQNERLQNFLCQLT